MKIHALLLLLAAALVAVASATSVAVIPLPVPSEEPECTGDPEGNRWRKDCNWCWCRNGREACTRRLCREGQEDEEPECEGTPSWKDGCNTCFCVDGRAVCTSEYCEGPPGPETVRVKRQALQCEEGSRWRVACNWCVCEGGQSSCTEAACNDWSEAKAVEEGIIDCHGESRWKKDCNWCTCVNGRGVCTTLACLPPERDPFYNLPENAVCVPGSRWKKDCNWCTCGENGFAACTLIGCLPGFKQEGSTCEEGSVWRNDCNICRCINGVSVCPKRPCRPQERPDFTSPQLPPEPQCQGEEEGDRWRQDCNWCRCRNGVGACTKRLCREGQKDEGPECEGNVSWKKDCNRCHCANGTAVCTSAFCGPLPARPTPHRGGPTREPECQGEEEEDRWRQDCNWCRCRNGVGACTKRLCPEGQTDEGPECEGNVSWKKDCNRCRCVSGNTVCTSAFCGPLPARPAPHRGGVTREPECQGEEEGDRWRQDCNWCRCRNGVGACTRRLCREGQKDEGPECEGNVSWRKDCNRCHCVNGTAVCTFAFCGPLPPRPVPRIEAQEPQCQGDPDTDRWIHDCNWCRCIDGGASCTKRLCRQDEESRPICEGNPTWKKDCNHCHCNNGTAVCTSMHCGDLLGPQRTLSVQVSHAKTRKAVCVDGSRWRVNCNWCSCHDGMAACTEKACLGQHAGKGEPECEGNSTWKNDCNWCTCGDGLAVCTKMACLKETDDVCTEGTSWRENCNICRCSQGFVLCTKRACDKQGKGLECQGDSCDPSELPELCSLPPVSGPLQCTGFFMKWSFSSTDGECKQIVYGGCAGTANLFDRRAECEAACPSPAPTASQTRRILPVAKAASSGGERCTLPQERGPCFAAFQRYAYNAVTGACEVFLFGGCGGNVNNFVTEEECVTACQGTQACDKSKCPWNLWGHYLAKECVPQYAGDACCPTSFQCPSASESGKDPAKCHYNGVAYNIGDSVPVEDPCSASCSCSASREPNGPPEVQCANVECPELFRPPQPGCRPLYSADRCCAYDYDCVDPAAPPLESRAANCVWQNETYLDGSKMYFDDHPCRSCICGPDFTGPNGPGCFNIDCGLTFRYTSQYHRGCSPIYFEGSRCCPIDWMCPDDSRIEPQQQQQQSGTVDESAVCRLGDRQFAVKEMLGLTDCKIECRCVTPPELTCIQYRSCEAAQEAAPQRECPLLKCHAGCRLLVVTPGECPTCSCTPGTFTCPAQTCPSTCHPEVDLQTGCPSCKCRCPSEVPCPMDCPVHTVLDEATGCPRCECQPGSPLVRSSCPEYPGGRVPCPQDCAVITRVDENGCERCECDPTDTGNPFGPPLPPQNPAACRTLPNGRAPCPMDCAIIRFTDENGCEVCKCDPNNPGNPFGPIRPPPPQHRDSRTCPGSGEAPCPMDCAVIRSIDESGCEVCKCDPNNPGNPFGPFRPPPPPSQHRVRRSCAGSGEAPCPMDCAVIRSIDENGCEVCKCDPSKSGNPFGPFIPPPKYNFYP